MRRILLAIVLIIAAVLLVGPFLIPVPPLTDTRPPAELADPDSRFVQVQGLQLHYKETGTGERTIVLLHGFGASIFTWREVMQPLAALGYRVVAVDRPAFGLTERPLVWERADWPGGSPYSTAAQVELTIRLMDALEIDEAVLAGNSAGGAIAMLTALAYPQRVRGLILLDPAVYAGGGSPPWIRPLLGTPQMQHVGPLIARRIQEWGLDFARAAWHDPSRITPDIWAGYTRPLQAENWDRALWNLTAASSQPDLPAQLSRLTLPVLVITGDDDRIVPTEQSVRLAGELPQAQLAVMEACGHTPHEECPVPTLAAIQAFLASKMGGE